MFYYYYYYYYLGFMLKYFLYFVMLPAFNFNLTLFLVYFAIFYITKWKHYYSFISQDKNTGPHWVFSCGGPGVKQHWMNCYQSVYV